MNQNATDAAQAAESEIEAPKVTTVTKAPEKKKEGTEVVASPGSEEKR